MAESLKVTVAMDSYKGSLSAYAAGEAVKAGILRACPQAEVFNVPISDGGEGLIASLKDSLIPQGYAEAQQSVMGAYQEATEAVFLKNHDRALVEMASVCGLYKYERSNLNVFNTTTYGLGELILHILSQGIHKITLGLGGSATNDGGAGMAQALGAQFYDKSGVLMKAPLLSGDLIKIGRIELKNLHTDLALLELNCCCDVQNPMIGPQGASYIFAQQKGAVATDLELLDLGMQNYVKALKAAFLEDYSEVSGSGAAGAIGGGLMYFCKAHLRSGIDNVLDLLGFDNFVKQSDLLIVGEGRTDRQTLNGKAPVGAALRAQKYGIPAIAISGGIEGGISEFASCNIHALFSICNAPLALEAALRMASELLEEQAYNVMKALTLLN